MTVSHATLLFNARLPNVYSVHVHISCVSVTTNAKFGGLTTMANIKNVIDVFFLEIGNQHCGYLCVFHINVPCNVRSVSTPLSLCN